MFSLKSLVAAVLLSSTVFACAAEPADDAESATETTESSADELTKAEAKAITVVAVAKVKPGTHAQFEAAAFGLVKGTRREAGNISYTMLEAKDDPNTFIFIEKWRSQAAIDQHMNGPVLGTFFAAVKDDFEPGYPTITSLGVVEPPAVKH